MINKIISVSSAVTLSQHLGPSPISTRKSGGNELAGVFLQSFFFQGDRLAVFGTKPLSIGIRAVKKNQQKTKKTGRRYGGVPFLFSPVPVHLAGLASYFWQYRLVKCLVRSLGGGGVGRMCSILLNKTLTHWRRC